MVPRRSAGAAGAFTSNADHKWCCINKVLLGFSYVSTGERRV